MDIKVLGSGCTKCKTLFKNVEEAIQTTGIEANLTKVEDIIEIMKLGVMTVPALIIDNKAVTTGRVPGVKDIIDILNQ